MLIKLKQGSDFLTKSYGLLGLILWKIMSPGLQPMSQKKQWVWIENASRAFM